MFARTTGTLGTPLTIALAALVASISVNVFTFLSLSRQQVMCEPTADLDDSQYSYVGSDHPARLPIYLPPVQLAIEDTMLFGLSDTEAWPTWRSTDYFPVANGFVRLGPQGRAFGISMFHQMHCLQMIRGAVLDNQRANSHTRHCFNLMRQAILCAADTTLDPLDKVDDNSNVGADGVGVVHQCKDWEKVYQYVIDNQGLEIWNQTSTKAPAPASPMMSMPPM